MSKTDVAATTAEILKPVIAHAAAEAVRNLPPSIARNSGAIAESVIKEVVPVVVNQTNQEPWYQSRTILLQYATLIIALLGIFGYTIAPELRDQIIAAVLAVGALVNPLLTLYARIFAKKPLGA